MQIGFMLFNVIHGTRHSYQVSLSFTIETIISAAFLNAAVGQLYGDFAEDRVRELLSVKDMAQEDMALLERVVDNAKEYFRDPERFHKAVHEEMGR